MILASLRLKYPFFKIYKLNCRISRQKLKKKIEKLLKIALRLPKSPYFFHFLGKKSFLNQTLGLRKSFLNQTTYILKNRLYQQTFLNCDSFLNWSFLNRDSTVLRAYCPNIYIYILWFIMW